MTRAPSTNLMKDKLDVGEKAGNHLDKNAGKRIDISDEEYPTEIFYFNYKHLKR